MNKKMYKGFIATFLFEIFFVTVNPTIGTKPVINQEKKKIFCKLITASMVLSSAMLIYNVSVPLPLLEDELSNLKVDTKRSFFALTGGVLIGAFSYLTTTLFYNPIFTKEELLELEKESVYDQLLTLESEFSEIENSKIFTHSFENTEDLMNYINKQNKTFSSIQSLLKHGFKIINDITTLYDEIEQNINFKDFLTHIKRLKEKVLQNINILNKNNQLIVYIDCENNINFIEESLHDILFYSLPSLNFNNEEDLVTYASVNFETYSPLVLMQKELTKINDLLTKNLYKIDSINKKISSNNRYIALQHKLEELKDSIPKAKKLVEKIMKQIIYSKNYKFQLEMFVRSEEKQRQREHEEQERASERRLQERALGIEKERKIKEKELEIEYKKRKDEKYLELEREKLKLKKESKRMAR
jgi:hypothetical protein